MKSTCKCRVLSALVDYQGAGPSRGGAGKFSPCAVTFGGLDCFPDFLVSMVAGNLWLHCVVDSQILLTKN